MRVKIYEYSNGQGGTWYKTNLIRDYGGRGCWELEVEIPDYLNPYETDFGICINPGCRQFLDECLIPGDIPRLKWDDEQGFSHIITLDPLSRTERSTAFYL